MSVDRPRQSLPKIMLWVASAALVVMMSVTVLDVILRFAFRIPVRGAYDVVSFSLLIMVFFGLAPVIARAGEITIDLIDHMVSPRVLVLLETLATCAAFAVFVFLGWSMISPAQDAYKWGGHSLELGMPVWWLWAVAFVGLSGILWVCLRRLIADIGRLRTAATRGPAPERSRT